MYTAKIAKWEMKEEHYKNPLEKTEKSEAEQDEEVYRSGTARMNVGMDAKFENLQHLEKWKEQKEKECLEQYKESKDKKAFDRCLENVEKIYNEQKRKLG